MATAAGTETHTPKPSVKVQQIRTAQRAQRSDKYLEARKGDVPLHRR